MGKVDVILMFQQSSSKLSTTSDHHKKKFRPLQHSNNASTHTAMNIHENKENNESTSYMG